MRVLVCGGRTYYHQRYLYAVLDSLHAATPVSVVIAGGARGADTLAVEWAESRKVPSTTFYAIWRRGKAAGPIRNARMLAEGKPDLVVAFPGGRGTADMVAKARAAGVEVREFPPEIELDPQ